MLQCIASNAFFEILTFWLLLSGAVGFFLMGIDKSRAAHGEWRIPEKVLFIAALVGGWLGTALGSEVFHHKTSKLSFLVVLYAIVGLWLLALWRIGFLSCLVAA